MKGIVIYGSKYGTTEQYAKELGKTFQFCVVDSESVRNLNDLSAYDVIIYGGGLYAGNITDLVKTLRTFPDIDSRKLLIFSVGLRDPKSTINTDGIKEVLQKQFSELNLPFNQSQVFHLRGGISFHKLGFKHRFMMKFVQKNPEEAMPETTPEEAMKAFSEDSNHVDFTALRPMIDKIDSMLTVENVV